MPQGRFENWLLERVSWIASSDKTYLPIVTVSHFLKYAKNVPKFMMMALYKHYTVNFLKVLVIAKYYVDLVINKCRGDHSVTDFMCTI